MLNMCSGIIDVPTDRFVIPLVTLVTTVASP